MLEHVVSLFGSFTQATRLLRLTTPLGSDELLAECVRGEESISAGYTFTISALSTRADISLRALLGQPALLELLTVNGGQPRPFHGYLTAIEMNGANGGMARYTLTMQPWTAFMARGRDSRVFQDMTVFDILDAVFGAYQGRGKLAPEWRFEVADRELYPVRSLTTQYQESDLAFAERLMSEEGLFYFFEHNGDADSASLGSHPLVIADDNSVFKPNEQAAIRYTQPGAVMKEDSIDRWRSELRLQTNAVELSSWDYRTRELRRVSSASVESDGAELVSSDIPGAYAYATRAQGQRIADNHIQALEAQREVFTGAGTVRTLRPGTTFALAGQASFDLSDNDDARSFTITRAVHLMHNNLSADLRSDVVKRIGQAALAIAIDEEQQGSLHAVGTAQGERPLYRNRIDAIRAAVPYRACRTDGHGQLLHPRPTVHGQQSAIVVGPAGAVVHTDRDHRVKVQFHWQRGAQSHSRLDHPAADSHTGAPADDTAGTWVRVATPLAPVAGANWGSHALPRVGQEVLVDFLEGNIDRPVIIGALYNGKGQLDAQNNGVAQGAGSATGNAPAWFPGDAAAHAHPAVLSGLKSQEMRASQRGAGAYSQLVFDDSPGQSRVGLQRHASAHTGTDELNMGHLRHQTDNQRLQPAGFGAELKTEGSTALRAAQGMLLSANARNGAVGAQMDSGEAYAQITESSELQKKLIDVAQRHNAKLNGKDGAEPAPEKLPAVGHMVRSATVIQTLAAGSSKADFGGSGKATAYDEPVMQLSSPSGIAAVTPDSTVIQAQTTSSIAAGQDINFTSQANSFNAVVGGISLFTYGKRTKTDKPNAETGLRLHSASGRLSTQSQTDVTTLTADKAFTVTSVTKSVNVAGKKHVLMTAQGAFIKLEGGNIQIHGPGKILFKASSKELAGPQSTDLPPVKFPHGDVELSNEKHHLYAGQYTVERKGLPVVGVPYVLTLPDGNKYFGETDPDGKTMKVGTREQKDLELTLLEKEDWDQENVTVWHQEDDRTHWS